MIAGGSAVIGLRPKYKWQRHYSTGVLLGLQWSSTEGRMRRPWRVRL
jgi:hypothetical protein